MSNRDPYPEPTKLIHQTDTPTTSSLKDDHIKIDENKLTSTTCSVTSPSQPTAHTWRVKVFYQLPWTGLGALILALLCAAASTYVLIQSNGAAIDSWKYRPALLVAIFTTLSNALIRYAFFQGVVITWWRQALDGCKLEDLHYIWAFGDSILASVMAGKHIRLLACASIMATVVMVEGPLLQRSTTTELLSRSSPINVQALIQPVWDMQSVTCYQGGRTNSVVGLSSSFVAVVRDYLSNAPITSSILGCEGTCISEVKGAGFSVDCRDNATNVDNSNVLRQASKTVPSIASDTLFSVDFKDISSSVTSGNFSLTTMYTSLGTNESACTGTKTTRKCTIQPAIVTYPVSVLNGSISLIPAGMGGYRTTPVPFIWYNVQAKTNPLGGFPFAMEQLFRSSGGLSYDIQSSGYSTFMTGMPANTYISSKSIRGGCRVGFDNPGPDVEQALHELAFRFALVSANKTSFQNITAEQTVQVDVFRSNYVFLAVAVGITLLTAMTILPTYAGWWMLGREFSLSPLETGRAFNAPLLHDANSNATIKQLNKAVGDQRIKYGEINLAAREQRLGQDEDVGLAVGTRLEINHPGVVRRPKQGSTFTE